MEHGRRWPIVTTRTIADLYLAAPYGLYPTADGHLAIATLDAVQQVRAPDGATLSLTRCPIRIDGHVLKKGRADTALLAPTS